METIKFRYTRHELWRYFRNAVGSLLRGFVRLAWSAVLLAANMALWARGLAASLVRRAPCAAVGVTFAVMLTVALAVHARMKVRLTTAEWQRDRLALKLDSMRMLHGEAHFGYQAYKAGGGRQKRQSQQVK